MSICGRKINRIKWFTSGDITIVKAVIQRVTRASVSVAGDVAGRIDEGLVALIGVASEDTVRDIEYITDKITNMRIFSDNDGKFNLSVRDTGGSILLISQFTLLADTRRGRRPSFIGAAGPEQAEKQFNMLVEEVRKTGINVQTGRFQQHMMVELVNDGPVTIIIDSKDKISADLTVGKNTNT